MSVTKLLLALVCILCSSAVKAVDTEFSPLQHLVSLVGDQANDLSSVLSEDLKEISLSEGKPLTPEQLKEIESGTSKIQKALSIFYKDGIIYNMLVEKIQQRDSMVLQKLGLPFTPVKNAPEESFSLANQIFVLKISLVTNFCRDTFNYLGGNLKSFEWFEFDLYNGFVEKVKEINQIHSKEEKKLETDKFIQEFSKSLSSYASLDPKENEEYIFQIGGLMMFEETKKVVARFIQLYWSTDVLDLEAIKEQFIHKSLLNPIVPRPDYDIEIEDTASKFEDFAITDSAKSKFQLLIEEFAVLDSNSAEGLLAGKMLVQSFNQNCLALKDYITRAMVNIERGYAMTENYNSHRPSYEAFQQVLSEGEVEDSIFAQGENTAGTGSCGMNGDCESDTRASSGSKLNYNSPSGGSKVNHNSSAGGSKLNCNSSCSGSKLNQNASSGSKLNHNSSGSSAKPPSHQTPTQDPQSKDNSQSMGTQQSQSKSTSKSGNPCCSKTLALTFAVLGITFALIGIFVALKRYRLSSTG